MVRFLKGLLNCLLGFIALQPAIAASGTVVVWDFDNNTVGPIQSIQAAEPLSRLLPEVLLENLSKLPEISVVERVRLREILEELKLGSNEISSEETRLRLGRILGAKNMVFGEYVLLAGMVRADIRLVEVETARILFSEPILGDEQSILYGTQLSAEKIARHISNLPTYSNTVARFPAEAWGMFNQGLASMDRKAFIEAAETFRLLLLRYPDFKPAERQLIIALERAARN